MLLDDLGEGHRTQIGALRGNDRIGRRDPPQTKDNEKITLHKSDHYGADMLF